MAEEKEYDESSGIGCRKIAFGGCLIIIAGIILLIFLLFTKSELVIGNLIDFLNKDIEEQEISSNESSYDILAEVYSQIDESSSEQILEFNEEELTILARASFTELSDLKVDIENEQMGLAWIIYDKIDDHPLYGVVKIKIEGETPKIEHFGTVRFGFPKIVNKIITNKASEFIEQGENDSIEDFFLKITNLESRFEVKNITFSDDKVIIILNAL